MRTHLLSASTEYGVTEHHPSEAENFGENFSLSFECFVDSLPGLKEGETIYCYATEQEVLSINSEYTTLSVIKRYDPCIAGWGKLLKSLGKTKADSAPLSFKHILESNGIKDAVWALRVLSFKKQVLFRADVASLVLHIFEDEYSNDSRPRDAIEALRKYASSETGEMSLDDIADDAFGAAFERANPSAAVADAAYAAYAAVTDYISASAETAYAVARAFSTSVGAADCDARQLAWQEIERLFIKYFCGN